MSEGTRKKTNANEITDDEWTVVRRKLAEVKDRLTHVHVEGVPKGEIEEILEDYVMQCEKALKTGKREDLPKRVITNLNAQKRDKENKALEKASSPVKAGETVPMPTLTEAHSSLTTTTVAKPSVQAGKGKANAPNEKKKGEKQEKPREEPVEIFSIESDVESDAVLGIDEQEKGTTEQKAGTGPAVQSTSANTSGTAMDADG